ncbi:MAG TPA: 50S ribosomal protein L19 [Nevskiaceae bacterium]|nr:50S ribosomal protein L19 [Nevskiaceae bacterium]
MANRIKIGETEFCVGDQISVQQKIKEGDKTRFQSFEGIVIAIKGRGENKMFTVRKIAIGGIGVERIWPANSPWVKKITVKKRGKVRRAKLYYLRKRTGRRAIKVKTIALDKKLEKKL